MRWRALRCGAMMKTFFAGIALPILLLALGADRQTVFPPFPGEKHLANIRKLTG